MTKTKSACSVITSYKIPTGETCTLLAFCCRGEPRVNGCTMFERGEEAKASMEEADFQKFWKYRDSVPSGFLGGCCCFVFPNASNAYHDVRYAGCYYGTWQHDRRLLVEDFWDYGLLVRFEP